MGRSLPAGVQLLLPPKPHWVPGAERRWGACGAKEPGLLCRTWRRAFLPPPPVPSITPNDVTGRRPLCKHAHAGPGVRNQSPSK